jgi:spore maturation protein CgeB
MSQHFWEKALSKRGHVLEVFYRNLPGGKPSASGHAERYTPALTPRKIWRAFINRVPPEANPILRQRNQQFISKVRAFQPDVLWMVGDNTVIFPETLAAVRRETGCKMVYACGTSPIVFSHTVDRRAARLYDLVLASDYYHGIQWMELGAKRMECLPLSACDPQFHHPYPLTDDERAKYACDIAFVGTLVPDHLYSRRLRALESLRDFDLGIWSVHEVPPSLQQFVRGRALGEDMLHILSAAKICFNTHGDFVFYGGNLRLFEVAGAGVFQVTDDLPGTRLWFPEIDGQPTILTYRSENDLREQVAYYLAHDAEREALARRAQAHVYGHHTYDVRAARFDEILATLPL